jgi:hypothetical protein
MVKLWGTEDRTCSTVVKCVAPRLAAGVLVCAPEQHQGCMQQLTCKHTQPCNRTKCSDFLVASNKHAVCVRPLVHVVSPRDWILITC